MKKISNEVLSGYIPGYAKMESTHRKLDNRMKQRAEERKAKRGKKQ